MKLLPVIVVAWASALGPAVAFADTPAVPAPGADKGEPKVQRQTEVRLVAELRAKDTAKVNIVTAGEGQKSSFARCAAASDPTLCRILVSAVNVAAIVGTNIPMK